MSNDYAHRIGVDLISAALHGDTARVGELMHELTSNPDLRASRARVAAAWIDATMSMLGLEPTAGWEPGLSAAVPLAQGEEVPDDVRWSMLAFAGRATGNGLRWGAAAVVIRVASQDMASRYLTQLLAMLANTLRIEAASVTLAAETQARAVAGDWPARAASLRANAAFN